jgi:hypothetical protein
LRASFHERPHPGVMLAPGAVTGHEPRKNIGLVPARGFLMPRRQAGIGAETAERDVILSRRGVHRAKAAAGASSLPGPPLHRER